jgi:hypothetical protein
MKLRNKNTGDIWDFDGGFTMKATHETAERAGAKSGILTCYAASLAELNRDWEDYKPAGPLIKDEKIRKAVRAWWEAIPDAITDKRVLYKKNQDLAVGVYTIYCGGIYPETLESGKFYTITELCGEEEA